MSDWLGDEILDDTYERQMHLSDDLSKTRGWLLRDISVGYNIPELPSVQPQESTLSPSDEPTLHSPPTSDRLDIIGESTFDEASDPAWHKLNAVRLIVEIPTPDDEWESRLSVETDDCDDEWVGESSVVTDYSAFDEWDEAYVRQEARDLVNDLRWDLLSERNQILVRKYFDGSQSTNAEIATEFDLSPNYIRTLILRCLKVLLDPSEAPPIRLNARIRNDIASRVEVVAPLTRQEKLYIEVTKGVEKSVDADKVPGQLTEAQITRLTGIISQLPSTSGLIDGRSRTDVAREIIKNWGRLDDTMRSYLTLRLGVLNKRFVPSKKMARILGIGQAAVSRYEVLAGRHIRNLEQEETFPDLP